MPTLREKIAAAEANLAAAQKAGNQTAIARITARLADLRGRKQTRQAKVQAQRATTRAQAAATDTGTFRSRFEAIQRAYSTAIRQQNKNAAYAAVDAYQKLRADMANEYRKIATTGDTARLNALTQQMLAVDQYQMTKAGAASNMTPWGRPAGTVDTPEENLSAWGLYQFQIDKFNQYNQLIASGKSQAAALQQTGLTAAQVGEWKQVASWDTATWVRKWNERLEAGGAAGSGKWANAQTPQQLAQWAADQGAVSAADAAAFIRFEDEARRLRLAFRAAHPEEGAQYNDAAINAQAARNVGLSQAEMTRLNTTFRGGEGSPLARIGDVVTAGGRGSAWPWTRQGTYGGGGLGTVPGTTGTMWYQMGGQEEAAWAALGTGQNQGTGQPGDVRGGVWATDFEATPGQYRGYVSRLSPEGQGEAAWGWRDEEGTLHKNGQVYLSPDGNLTWVENGVTSPPGSIPATAQQIQEAVDNGLEIAGQGGGWDTGSGQTGQAGTSGEAGAGGEYDPWWAAPWAPQSETPTGPGTPSGEYAGNLSEEKAAAEATKNRELAEFEAAKAERDQIRAELQRLRDLRAAAIGAAEKSRLSAQIEVAKSELDAARDEVQRQQQELQMARQSLNELREASREYVDYYRTASLLMSWLPEGAANLYADLYAQYGGDADLALAAFRADSRYEGWFPGNRDPNGRLILSEENYADTMTGYAMGLVNYNINPTLFYQRFPDLVRGHVSVDEFQTRLEMSYNDLQQNIAPVRRWYAQEYGLGELTDEALLASMLDPQVGEDILQRRISMAQIGGEGLAHSLSISNPSIMRLLSLGYGQTQAADLFAKASYFLPRLGGAAGRARAGAFGIEEYLAGEAFGEAGALQTIERLQARESSLFSEASDVAGAETGILRGLREQ